MSSFNVFGLFALAQGKRVATSNSTTLLQRRSSSRQYHSLPSWLRKCLPRLANPSNWTPGTYQHFLKIQMTTNTSVGHAPAIHIPQTLNDGSKVFTLSATEYVCGTFKNSAVSPISSFAPPDAGFLSSTAYATQ
ncbi:hypothetical protein B0H19DRAFT_1065326 [Mycena capillaripes]|nr:hypothetical protein B0H19DRAFT_1065326 [Mycena capillaripes]